MNISIADRAALLSLIERFAQQEIIVMGDLVADEFIHGEIARVSREAPVLILRQREKRTLPGGGANAANNLADLGAKIHIAGIVGEDEPGSALLRYFNEKDISTRSIKRVKGFVTPAKSRVLGGLGHGHMQQIVRVDREPPRKLDGDIRRELCRNAVRWTPGSSGVLISDYGYGAAGPEEARLLQQRRAAMPVVVDSRYEILRYNHVTAGTPNETEMEAAHGERVDNNLQALHRMAAKTLRRCSFHALLVTRGREGMALYESGQKPRVLTIFGSDQVADVTGAGDTVIAAFTLSLAAGASFTHAAMIANCAGGLVVMKSGTATVTARELREAIRNV